MMQVDTWNETNAKTLLLRKIKKRYDLTIWFLPVIMI